MTINRFFNKRRVRIVSIISLFVFIGELFFPALSFALTGGPSQPEAQGFEPAGTTQMVNPFTGDFTYNIPLLDVEGYPINLSYHSGVTMDQEASWVGLGWSLNPGAIDRDVRGIPDDFDGDKGDFIEKEMTMKPNRTYGVEVGPNVELFGADVSKLGVNVSAGLKVLYNNYRGYSVEKNAGVTLSMAASKGSEGRLGAGLSLSSSSDGDFSVSPDVSYSSKGKKNSATKNSFSLGSQFSSREGLSHLSFNVSSNKGSVSGKKKYVSLGGNGGGSISFSAPSFTPFADFPIQNTSGILRLKLGSEFIVPAVTLSTSAFYSEQRLAIQKKSYPAYGYMNSEKTVTQTGGIQDVNREKDGAFSANTPNLSVPVHTYDLFNVSGQGTGGMFRAHRSDVGYLYDTRVTNTNNSYSLGGELAFGNAFKGGIDAAIIDSRSENSPWTDGNSLARQNKFRPKTIQNINNRFEPYYFKEVGELNADDDKDFFDNIDGVDPVKPEMYSLSGLNVGVNSTMNGKSPKNIRTHRNKRNKAIYSLTVAEAANFGVLTDLYKSPAKKTYYKDHHIGEVTVLNPDGTRYIYGNPVYNKTKEEHVFSVTGGDAATGLVTYDASDDGTGNNKGTENFYSKTTTSPYPYAYMLTAVLSSDFVDNDVTPGPSNEDAGNYTVFSYKKPTNLYKWRTPVSAKVPGNMNAPSTNYANFEEGLLSDPNDNKGSYIYGEKELNYLEEIETKNFYAVFVTEDREDGGGFTRDGSLDKSAEAAKPQLLRAIKLYSKTDRTTPIKTVHFEYDYSLCPGVPNNIIKTNDDDEGTGKLTLKYVYFTYEGSEKGKDNPYFFEYNGINPHYNAKSSDRWGNYDPNLSPYFPYVNQIGGAANSGTNFRDDVAKKAIDTWVSAWHLTDITTPAGSKISVEYESDDYASVQDRKPMRMFRVNGVGANSSLFSPTATSATHSYTLYIQLDKEETKATFFEKYLKGIDQLMFRFLVDLGNSESPNPNHEYVPGYAKIIDYGVNGTNAWIELEPATISGGTKVNPIAKAAWQFCKLHRPDIAFGGGNIAESGFEQVIKGMISSDIVRNLITTINGIDRTMMLAGKCQTFVPSSSYIRLMNPNGFKLGGGARVRTVMISGEDQDKFGLNKTYGQRYEYTVMENGKSVSSGVAAYEPFIGGEENPFRQPIFYGGPQKLLVPDERYYLEGPVGESYFPAPMVGYSQVKITDIEPSSNELGNGKYYNPGHSMGYTLHQFYTAKDFPTIARQTELQVMPKKSSMLNQLLNISVKNYLFASQGYMIETNDMHGKSKATWVYAQGQVSPLSGMEYFYKTEAGNASRLSNMVQVADSEGKIISRNIGLEHDFVLDARKQVTNNKTFSINGNLAAFFIAIFPGAVPTVFPSVATEEVKFQSAVAMKSIHRSGLLERTVAHDLGSSVASENLVYDAETGEMLLNKTYNQFGDPLYNYTLPAHRAYEGMEPAYKNIGYEYELDFESGLVDIADKALYDNFVEGDELEIIYNKAIDAPGASAELRSEKTFRFWVVEKRLVTPVEPEIEEGDPAPEEEFNPDPICFIKIMGGDRKHKCSFELSGRTRFKIIRSGHRNMQSMPISTVVSLSGNPIKTLLDKDGNSYTGIDFNTGVSPSGVASDSVLAASAHEYSPLWDPFCECLAGADPPQNDYYLARKGNWRHRTSYMYNAPRLQDPAANVVRKGGAYKTFSMYWQQPTPEQKTNYLQPPLKDAGAADAGHWVMVTERNAYDINAGQEMENKDALNRYSSAEYRYNHSLPVFRADNAKRNYVLFDSFEDYRNDLNDCFIILKLQFEGGTPKDTESHSGRTGMQVSKDSRAVLKVDY